MQTFLAKLMFNIHVDENKHTNEFDEQIRLIHAPNHEAAYFKAHHIGKSEENVVENNAQKINWKFVGVADLYPLKNLKDGEQLYSNTIYKDDSHSFTQYIRQKAIELQVKNLSFA